MQQNKNKHKSITAKNNKNFKIKNIYKNMELMNINKSKNYLKTTK